MYKILIIVDKFKGSLTAREVSSIINGSFATVLPDAKITAIPLADGGDGTIDALEHFGDEVIPVETVDPLGKPLTVPVLRVGNKVLCEMAKSTGLWSLSKEERDPRYTSSYGFGVVIEKVARMGFNKILLGIGGSATNDAGAGMLSALGFRFLDKNHRPVCDNGFVTGCRIGEIYHIDDTNVPYYIRNLEVEVACDVNNPLTGIYGASHVYGPQKGATPGIVETLERGVVKFAGVSTIWSGRDLTQIPGAGAAGGVGYALALFLDAKLLSGWRLLFDLLGVEAMIGASDLVITGEGRVDGQSLSGKLLDGVLQRAGHHRKRVWVICGDNLLTDRELEIAGVERLFAISGIQPVKEVAIANGSHYLEKISRHAATFLKPSTSNDQTI